MCAAVVESNRILKAPAKRKIVQGDGKTMEVKDEERVNGAVTAGKTSSEPGNGSGSTKKTSGSVQRSAKKKIMPDEVMVAIDASETNKSNLQRRLAEMVDKCPEAFSKTSEAESKTCRERLLRASDFHALHTEVAWLVNGEGQRRRERAAAGGAQDTDSLDLLAQGSESRNQLMTILKAHIKWGADVVIARSGDGDGLEEDGEANCLEDVKLCLICIATFFLIESSPSSSGRQHIGDDAFLQDVVLSLRLHLTHNVLAVCDPYFYSLYRQKDAGPSSKAGAGNVEKKSRTPSSKTPKKSGNFHTLIEAPWLGEVAGLVADGLHMLERAMPTLLIADSTVLQLCRACLGVLTTNSAMLQWRATDVIARIFELYSSHRHGIALDVVNMLLRLHMQPNAAERKAHAATKGIGAKGDRPWSPHPGTALILVILQATTSVPADEHSAAHGLEELMECSGVIWTALMQRLVNTKAEESQAKHVFERLVNDLLMMRSFPEYPASDLALFRLCQLLNGGWGLKHESSFMRQMAVDTVGKVLHAIKESEVDLKKESSDAAFGTALIEIVGRERVHDVEKQLVSVGEFAGLKLTRKSTPRDWILQQILLEELCNASSSSSSDANESAPGRCVVCISLAEHLRRIAAESKEQDDAKVAKMALMSRTFHQQRLLRRKKRDTPSMSREKLIALTQTLVAEQSMAKSWRNYLSWMVDSFRNSPEPGMRCRAMKAMAHVTEADSKILMISGVQSAVRRGLADKSILVREASLDLVGKHTSAALNLLPTISRCLYDPGVSVKKRALRILQDICVAHPGLDGCESIIARILYIFVETDDEGVQDLILRLIEDMWFTDSGDIDENLESFRKVCKSMYQSLCQSANNVIKLPLKADNPLIMAVRKVTCKDDTQLSKSEKVRLRTARTKSRTFCTTLLENIVEASNNGGGDDEQALSERFSNLLALHVFAVVEPNLCVSAPDGGVGDVQHTLSILKPYLKDASPAPASDADDGNSPRQKSRVEAEQLVTLIHIINDLVPVCKYMVQDAVSDVSMDLVSLLKTSTWLPIASSSCQCLCTLAKLSPSTCASIVTLANAYRRYLSVASVPHVQKALHTLGCLCRYGCASGHPLENSLRALREDFCGTFSSGGGGTGGDTSKIQKFAIDALGNLVCANPAEHMTNETTVHVFRDGLSSADSRVQVAVLSTIREILILQEGATRSADDHQPSRTLHHQANGMMSSTSASPLPLPSSSSLDMPLVPSEAGSGDSYVGSRVIQLFWERVLDSLSSAYGYIRYNAIEVVAVVLRNGLVHPATAYSRLFSALADNELQVRSMGMKLLRQGVERHASLVDSVQGAGLQSMFMSLCSLFRDCGDCYTHALQGVAQLYEMRPDVHGRKNFLRALLRSHTRELSSGGGAGHVGLRQENSVVCDVRFQGFCIEALAALPFKKADDPAIVVGIVNDIVSTRADHYRSQAELLLARAKGGTRTSEAEGDADHGQSWRGCVMLCQLLLLKEHLMKSYGLASVMMRNGRSASGGKDVLKQSENRPTFSLEALNLTDTDPAAPTAMAHQLSLLISLLDGDTNDYCEIHSRGHSVRAKANKRKRANADDDANDDSDDDDDTTFGGNSVITKLTTKSRPKRNVKRRCAKYASDEDDGNGTANINSEDDESWSM